MDSQTSVTRIAAVDLTMFEMDPLKVQQVLPRALSESANLLMSQRTGTGQT